MTRHFPARRYQHRKGMHMRSWRYAVCILAILLLGSALAQAQQTGVLTGIVSDKSGAVISDASIVVDGGDLGRKTDKSDKTGNYSLSGLQPGIYIVVISAPGFKDFVAEEVEVKAGERTVHNASLELAETKVNVEVVGQGAAQVETETNEVAETITQKEVVSLGLNGRSVVQVVALAPGVSNQTGQDEAKVGVVGSAKYSVNGGRVEYNAFDVDSSEVLNTGINASRGKSLPLIVYPSLDAISEVKVLTSNYGAQYGRSASGSVMVTTKSGTSEFHGDVYEFLRNNIFNARNYFDDPTKGAPTYHRNDFGFTLGGPLYIPKFFNTKKNKTFFFFSEEARLERSPLPNSASTYNQAVPSLAERGIGVLNPQTGQPFANGTVADFTDACDANSADCPGTGAVPHHPYSANLIPINPLAQQILSSGIIPLPTPNATSCNSSIGSCFVETVSPNTYWREELFRIDHNFSDQNKLSIRYIHDTWNTTVTAPEWQYGNYVNSFPSVLNSFVGPGLSAVVRFDQIISPTFLNQISFSFTDSHITLTNENGAGVNLSRPSLLDQSPCPPSVYGSLDTVSGPCMGYLFDNGFGGKMPGIWIAGNNAAYGGTGFLVDSSYMPWSHRNPTFDFRQNLSKVLGKHTLQAGVQVVYSRESETNAATGANTGDTQGLLTYSNANSLYSTGNAFADFLLGPGSLNNAQFPDNRNGIQYFQQDSSRQKYYLHYITVEPWIQDDWRVTHRLTLNLGMRFSLFGNWQMENGMAWNWLPSAYSQQLAAQVDVYSFNGALYNAYTGQPYSLPSNPNPSNLNIGNNPIFNGLVQCGTGTSSCMTSHIFNPAPRIGLAWDPTGSGRTSIRAGYGMFFEHGTSSEANVGSLMGNAPLVIDMTEPMPEFYYSIGGLGSGSGTSPATAYPINLTAIPSKMTWPYVQQWSLSVQREIAKNTMVSIAYVGSKGTHLSSELQVNQLAPVSSALNPFPANTPLTNSICQSYNVGSFTVGSTTVYSTDPAFINLEAACFGIKVGIPAPATLRPYYGLGEIYSLQNIATSTYHALQITLRRSHGPLTFGLAYSYGHSIDDSSDRSDANFVNSYNLASNRASSDFDQRHILNVSYVYRLPSVKYTGRLASLLKKWEVSGDHHLPDWHAIQCDQWNGQHGNFSLGQCRCCQRNGCRIISGPLRKPIWGHPIWLGWLWPITP